MATKRERGSITASVGQRDQQIRRTAIQGQFPQSASPHTASMLNDETTHVSHNSYHHTMCLNQRKLLKWCLMLKIHKTDDVFYLILSKGCDLRANETLMRDWVWIFFKNWAFKLKGKRISWNLKQSVNYFLIYHFFIIIKKFIEEKTDLSCLTLYFPTGKSKIEVQDTTHGKT